MNTPANPAPSAADNAPTPEQRAQWLHDHKAPKDWIVFTESEVAELKRALAAKDREIEHIKSKADECWGAANYRLKYLACLFRALGRPDDETIESNISAATEQIRDMKARVEKAEQKARDAIAESDRLHSDLVRRDDETEAEISALRAEVERPNRPWTVSIIVPTKNDPFNRHHCEVVDVGHADRHLVVECSELRARLGTAEAALAAAQADKERLDWLEENAGFIRVSNSVAAEIERFEIAPDRASIDQTRKAQP